MTDRNITFGARKEIIIEGLMEMLLNVVQTPECTFYNPKSVRSIPSRLYTLVRCLTSISRLRGTIA